ncbi:hypothetical protein DL764_004268 [Monosporascus ibericus]|uniref:Uncharacterized protein n=1 Tax=Monosporascus ibericus TaxID=155417 RepID=A0A4Q4TDT4_9PEZI|nr:hypothetical protein DL764_004268 [Monosporascus ibericus]
MDSPTQHSNVAPSTTVSAMSRGLQLPLEIWTMAIGRITPVSELARSGSTAAVSPAPSRRSPRPLSAGVVSRELRLEVYATHIFNIHSSPEVLISKLDFETVCENDNRLVTLGRKEDKGKKERNI